MPGGNPVTEMPGETPTLPVMTLAPVLVTVEPPRTAKLPAVPRLTCASADEEMERNAAIPRIARRPRPLRFMFNLLASTAASVSQFHLLACCSHISSFQQ